MTPGVEADLPVTNERHQVFPHDAGNDGLQRFGPLVEIVRRQLPVTHAGHHLGPVKVVPLSRISIGFGGGGGEGDQRFGHHREKKNKHPAGKGSGGGGGGRAKVRPVGVLVFTEDGVNVERIPDKTGLCDKIFDRIPDIIDLAKKHKH